MKDKFRVNVRECKRGTRFSHGCLSHVYMRTSSHSRCNNRQKAWASGAPPSHVSLDLIALEGKQGTVSAHEIKVQVPKDTSKVQVYVDLTVEKVRWQRVKWHWISSKSLESLASCDRRCRLMFFLSCLVPQVSQSMYWWEDKMWALRQSTLLNDFMQSQQKASVISSLTAVAEIIWIKIDTKVIR